MSVDGTPRFELEQSLGRNIDIVNGREIPGSLKGIKRSLDSIKVSKAIQKVYKSVERPATVSR
jgi:hypothetical protein